VTGSEAEGAQVLAAALAALVRREEERTGGHVTVTSDEIEWLATLDGAYVQVQRVNDTGEIRVFVVTTPTEQPGAERVYS
jgi:hypothetical protein